MIADLNPVRAHKMVEDFPQFFSKTVDINDIEASTQYLKDLSFSNEDILKYPTILLQHRITLSNRKQVLEECCFREVNIKFLYQFITLMNKNIVTLKSDNLISVKADVPKNILKQINDGPSFLELSSSMDDKMQLKKLRWLIISHFLKCKLKVTDEELTKLPKMDLFRLRHRSLRSLVETVDVLQNKLNFSSERILKNAYLLQAYADNLNEIITELPQIGNVPIEELIKRFPKLALNKVETTKLIIGHVRSFNIPEICLLKDLQILSLSPATVYDRLVEMTKIEEFDVLRNHPRVLRLVHYYNKATIRLAFFKQLNVKCTSLNVLVSASPVFEKYARDGVDKTNGQDTIIYIEETLKRDRSWAKAVLNRHPHWLNIPVRAVRESINYLQNEGFTEDEICENLHLVLYPKHKIEQKLNFLMQKGSETDGKNLDSNVSIISEISNSKLLNLCLYFIEAEYHFSGDGVWETQKHDKQDLAQNIVLEFPKTLIKDYRYNLSHKRVQKGLRS